METLSIINGILGGQEITAFVLTIVVTTQMNCQ